jgi:transcriptional repressor NrdR
VRCPFCHHQDDRVVDSRTSREGRAVRRRRECLRCGRRFTTYEYIEERTVQVLKRDGETEPFEHRKLLKSIEIASAKRPITPAEIETVVEDIERELDRRETSELASSEIGEMVMQRLKERDQITYVRYASVYRNFADVQDFEEELKELRELAALREVRRFQRELPLAEDDDEDEPGDAPAASPPDA